MIDGLFNRVSPLVVPRHSSTSTLALLMRTKYHNTLIHSLWNCVDNLWNCVGFVDWVHYPEINARRGLGQPYSTCATYPYSLWSFVCRDNPERTTLSIRHWLSIFYLLSACNLFSVSWHLSEPVNHVYIVSITNGNERYILTLLLTCCTSMIARLRPTIKGANIRRRLYSCVVQSLVYHVWSYRKPACTPYHASLYDKNCHIVCQNRAPCQIRAHYMAILVIQGGMV